MLTGRVPFNSTSEYELMRRQIEDAPEPPRTHAPHIPLPVEQAIMRSLAKKREARYQSAGGVSLEANESEEHRCGYPASHGYRRRAPAAMQRPQPRATLQCEWITALA